MTEEEIIEILDNCLFLRQFPSDGFTVEIAGKETAAKEIIVLYQKNCTK